MLFLTQVALGCTFNKEKRDCPKCPNVVISEKQCPCDSPVDCVSKNLNIEHNLVNNIDWQYDRVKNIVPLVEQLEKMFNISNVPQPSPQPPSTKYADCSSAPRSEAYKRKVGVIHQSIRGLDGSNNGIRAYSENISSRLQTIINVVSNMCDEE